MNLSVLAPVSSVVSGGLIGAIRLYQRFLSPLLPPACRYEPSCSHYTLRAIQVWGPLKGVWLGTKRICRCQPFFPGGLDPVPLPPGMSLPSISGQEST